MASTGVWCAAVVNERVTVWVWGPQRELHRQNITLDTLLNEFVSEQVRHSQSQW